jgi:hypothetical protein
VVRGDLLEDCWGTGEGQASEYEAVLRGTRSLGEWGNIWETGIFELSIMTWGGSRPDSESHPVAAYPRHPSSETTYLC